MEKRKNSAKEINKARKARKISSKYVNTALKILAKSKLKYGAELEFSIPNELSYMSNFIGHLKHTEGYYNLYKGINCDVKFKGTLKKHGADYVKVHVTLQNRHNVPISKKNLEDFVHMVIDKPDLVTIPAGTMGYEECLEEISRK